SGDHAGWDRHCIGASGDSGVEPGGQGRLAGRVPHPAGAGEPARLPDGVLPAHGRDGEMIADKRDVLARNLIRAPLEVWPAAADHAGYVDLWVADPGS